MNNTRPDYLAESPSMLASILLAKPFAAPVNPAADITYTSTAFAVQTDGSRCTWDLSAAYQGSICSASVHGAVVRIAVKLGLAIDSLYTVSFEGGWDVYGADDSLVGRVGVYSVAPEQPYKYTYEACLADPTLDPKALKAAA